MSIRPGRTSLPLASRVCLARASGMSASSAAITALRMPTSRRARNLWLVSSTSPPLMTRSNLSVCASAPAAPRPSKVLPAAAPARNSRREMGRIVFSVWLFLLRLAFGRAGIIVRAAVADHTDRLDLDLDARPREVRHRDEHGHLHDVGEAAAGALHDLIHL